MNIIMMVGKQAGIIGMLTVLANGHTIKTAVCYDDITKDFCKEYGIPILKSIHDLPKFNHAAMGSDVLLSVHGREIVPPEYFEMIQCVNVHPCLSEYPGANPIFRLLADKNPNASVGVHWMSKEVDKGKPILELFTNVKECRTEVEVYNKLYPIYAKAISMICKSKL